MTPPPLRAILVGAGAMGRAWITAFDSVPDVVLVGVVDLNLAAARLAAEGREGVLIDTDLTAIAKRSAPDLVVNVTVPEAHHPITMTALALGLPVLGEKPLAATMSEAVSLAEAADRSGLLFAVSQSRRYNRELFALREHARRLGRIGIVTTEFFKEFRPGGFREQMAHPLLLDMSIHSFDAARFLLDCDPVSVWCDEHNPAWSWYAGAAAATAVFEMRDGLRFVYTGSWCSQGLATSWNGSWRISGSRGSAIWDGESVPRIEAEPLPGKPLPDCAEAAYPGDGIIGALTEFASALRAGTRPMGHVADNLISLAMVHAAITSSERGGRRVAIAEIISKARDEAADS